MFNTSFMDDCFYTNSSRNLLFDYESVSTYQKTLKDNENTLAAQDRKKYVNQIKRELKLVENYTATDSFDFLQTWFNNNCVNKSSCRIPGMTQASGYTYLWDVDKDDNKYEDDKFIIFPRYDWGGYRMKSKCFDKVTKIFRMQIFPSKRKTYGVLSILLCPFLSEGI